MRIVKVSEVGLVEPRSKGRTFLQHSSLSASLRDTVEFPDHQGRRSFNVFPSPQLGALDNSSSGDYFLIALVMAPPSTPGTGFPPNVISAARKVASHISLKPFSRAYDSDPN